MKYAVIQTENARASCLGYNDESLLISSETLHADFESLAQYCHSFQKSGTNGYAAIPLNQIQTIQFHEHHAEFFIQYKKEGSPKLNKYYFSIASDKVRHDFCEGLAEASGLRSKKEFESHFARITDYLIFIGLTVLFTYVAQYVAKGGLAYSRKAVVHLVAELLEMLGPTIPIVIGSMLCAYYLYKIIYNFFRPTKTIIYT